MKPTSSKSSTVGAARALPTVAFASQAAWTDWLEENHRTSPGLWLLLAKKASGVASVSYDEAVEVALCFGWIDGQKDRHDDQAWLQKFTPRGPRSVWSKINVARVERLTAAGAMRPAGLEVVVRAKEKGQWEAAYDAPSTSTVPADFQAALDGSKGAAAFFATLNSANRYAMLWRIQTAKKAETRARRIAEFIAMLERKEKLHP
jgi:uncharacterized protein YdeI (YjbR/CyaY-like superfamily)